MNHTMKRTILLILLLLTALAVSTSAQSKKGTPEQQINAVMDLTAHGWNNGILSEYLSAYVPEATEMLSTGPAGGVEAIEKTMKEGFWKTGRPLQVLRYEHIVVRMLGKDNALVTGQFILSGNNRPDRTGWFTTVWTRTKDGWRMIHDHS